jgi:hypothetical protein
MLMVLGWMSCATAPPAGAPDGKSPTPVSGAGMTGDTPAATTPPADAPTGASAFESQVQPILQQRCRPCHFEGGVMYVRLPFDCPQTVRLLGTKLFTRIRDEGEQATINLFLAQPPDLDGETPAHCRIIDPP